MVLMGKGEGRQEPASWLPADNKPAWSEPTNLGSSVICDAAQLALPPTVALALAEF